jgi:SAM-dependent methyltransferase
MALHERVESFIHFLRYRQVCEHLRPCERMVDLGCGETYRFLKKFGHLARECWGLDVTVNDGKDENVFLREFDVTKGLPFADKTVDIVTCLAVLEHIEEPISIFRETLRILKPGGRLIVTTPSRWGILAHEALRFFRLVQDVAPGEHKDFNMTRKKISSWCRETGLYVEAVCSFECGLNIILVGRKP